MGDLEIHVSEQGQWKGFRRWQGNAGQKPAEPRDGASMVAILDGATKLLYANDEVNVFGI